MVYDSPERKMNQGASGGRSDFSMLELESEILFPKNNMKRHLHLQVMHIVVSGVIINFTNIAKGRNHWRV